MPKPSPDTSWIRMATIGEGRRLTKRCNDITAHGPHEWSWKRILRRECPGLVVAFCGRDETHGPHWHGEYRDELCHGCGLAGLCKHGVGMLDECPRCEDEAAEEREAEPEALMNEIVTMHNDLYHPGQDCPDDDDWECSVRRDKEGSD